MKIVHIKINILMFKKKTNSCLKETNYCLTAPWLPCQDVVKSHVTI